MEIEQLPKPARKALIKLQQEVLKALETSETEHLTAVSASSVPREFSVDQVLEGGSIQPPERPFIRHDENAITELHWQVHRASEELLYRLVINADQSEDGSWNLRTKLISTSEHDALIAARQPIDAAVEVELRKLIEGPDWDHASFGRLSATLPIKLSRFSEQGRDQLKPTENFLTQLKAADRLYNQAGHQLLVAHWTLREGTLDFREYFQ